MSNRLYYRLRVSMLGAVFVFFRLKMILMTESQTPKRQTCEIFFLFFVLAVTPIVIYSQTTRKITCVCIPFPVGDIFVFVSSCVISFLLSFFSLSFSSIRSASFFTWWCFTQFRIPSCCAFFLVLNERNSKLLSSLSSSRSCSWWQLTNLNKASNRPLRS